MKVTTQLEKRLWYALKRISLYDSPERLIRIAEKEYACSPREALEGAYENIIGEAKAAIKGVRLPKPSPRPSSEPTLESALPVLATTPSLTPES